MKRNNLESLTFLTSMDFVAHMAHLSGRHKPPTDVKIRNLHHGMVYMYRWHPVLHIFEKIHHPVNQLFEDGTVLVYFRQSMLAVQFPRGAFDGNTLPKTWLNDAVQIRYRCAETGSIAQGCLLLGSDLLPEMLMISDKSLLEMLPRQ